MASAAAPPLADLPRHKILTAPPPSTTAAADPARVRALVDLLTRVPASDIDQTLANCSLAPSPSDVDSVLPHLYSVPATAVKFFRWSGVKNPRLSPLSWTLMVDILAKNSLFEAMWDAIRSMKHDGLLTSLSPFASAFSSYASAGRIKEAAMTFDVMDRYGVAPDTLALNSLLSAICRVDGRTADAAEVFNRFKTRVAPDADSFAILLEGWEKENDMQHAKTTFGEMVIRIGWNKNNMSAYDAFLTTLVRGGQPDEALNFLKVMKGKNCLPGIKFFANALDILVKSSDAKHTVELWDLMVVESGLVPNLVMYNAIIALVCNEQDFEAAYRFLDAMPFHGAFPESLTYNTIFECLVRNRKAKDAEKFFGEMRKNEMSLSRSNCVAAIKMFFEEFDPATAMQVWNYAAEERGKWDEECANELLVGLASLERLSEVRRFADEMIDMGVHLRSATLDKLESALSKGRRRECFDHIERRVKRRLKQ